MEPSPSASSSCTSAQLTTPPKTSRMWREALLRADALVTHYREITTRTELNTEGAPYPI
eukprot:CAMPEP_0172087950 /NCGR_PEP_ID=MMETSP1043-20130122/22969_1 /TAXON_ID=464988 /ORGANISM="Hemiselmis andersenii, Strain CCMP441" /LENGTH=58 /DNA_ID=CAMNT_0012750213 /DNA_START=123 /DNA_END=296 /DNA_ORIENTATION=+